MKSLLRVLILALISFPQMVSAQDWQCLRDGVTANFIDTTAFSVTSRTKSMWTVGIDSVSIAQGWTTHHGFHSLRLVSISYLNGTYFTAYCYNQNGASRMGMAMVDSAGENLFFNSAGDTIRISTLRQINQPWKCCRVNDSTLLYATVSYLGVEPVLGVPDSVKYISFQAKNSSGELVSHPLNSKLFGLSMHSGMITLFDMLEFPNLDAVNSTAHVLAGTKSQALTRGEQNLTYQDIYSFAPGDVFHTYSGGHANNYQPAETKTVIRILDATWNPGKDTVTYRMSRYIDYWAGWPDINHKYSKDIVSASYPIHASGCSGLDNFPEQSIFCMNANGTLKTVNSFIQFRDSDYNGRWIKSQENPYTPGSYCADSLVELVIPALEYSYWSGYYISGCGGPFSNTSYTGWDHKTTTTFYKLVYFKKGAETWGTPLDTTNWATPNVIPDTGKVEFNIFPNPSADNHVTVETADSGKATYLVEIYSLTGLKIYAMEFSGGKQSLDVSKYSSGMYILKLYRDKLQVGQQKLILCRPD